MADEQGHGPGVTTLVAVSTTRPERPHRLDRLGPLFASLWLFFLVNPLL